MRSLLIPAAVAALTLGTARQADAQVYSSGGYVMPQTSWVQPASAYPGGFYNPVVTSTYVDPAPFVSIYTPPLYGGVIVNRPYSYGFNNRYYSGYRSYSGVNYGYGRRWRR